MSLAQLQVRLPAEFAHLADTVADLRGAARVAVAAARQTARAVADHAVVDRAVGRRLGRSRRADRIGRRRNLVAGEVHGRVEAAARHLGVHAAGAGLGLHARLLGTASLVTELRVGRDARAALGRLGGRRRRQAGARRAVDERTAASGRASAARGAGLARRSRLARRPRGALRAARTGGPRVARIIAATATLENERQRRRAQHRLNRNPLSHLEPSFVLAALRANPSPLAGFCLLRGCPYGIRKAHGGPLFEPNLRGLAELAGGRRIGELFGRPSATDGHA